MKITFLGTGTSLGSPVVACNCATCRSVDHRDRRLRTSALITIGSTTIVIDAGPDFRQQMLAEDVKRVDGILLTHEHKDHIAGLDDVRGFNHAMNGPVDIYATERVLGVVRKDFDYAFAADRYPGAPRMRLFEIADEVFEVGRVEVMPIRGMHAMMPVTGYRIGGLAYLTDFNAITDEEEDKLRGVEVLVVNALRKEKHLSHFTLDEALHLSERVGASRTFLTHVSHEMGLYQEVAQGLPEGATLAYDGLVYEF